MITKEKFLNYRYVQMSGMYNMFTEAYLYKDIIGCTLDEVWDIISNYETYYNKYITKAA